MMKNYFTPLLSSLAAFAFCILVYPDPVFAGPGIHGAKIINTTNVILNEFTTLTSDVIAGATSATVANSSLNANGRFAGNLAAGELVMIIQMQGASMNTASATSPLWGSIASYNNAGHYEFNEVLSVPNGTTIVFVAPLVNSYTASGKVQVIRVQRYTTFVITGAGSLTTPPWNGSTGGVIAIEANGNAMINGSIDVSGLGFRGGIVDSSANSNHIIYASTLKDDGGEKGEGISGTIASYDVLGGRYGRGAPANGGGGGNAHNTGGGGGSNADNGITYDGLGIPDTVTDVNWKTAWDLEGGNFHTNISSGGGRGGYSFNMKNRNPLTTAPANVAWMGDDRYNVGGWGGHPLNNSGNRIYLGGGGGAGDSNNNSGGGGGNGGGIVVLLVGGNVAGGGIINANGSNGINSTANDAAGGGGGGGSVVIFTRAATSSGVFVNAKGGKGGDQARIANTSGEGEGPGGGGGGGFVSITSPSSIAVSVTGGANGTTNSPTFVSFLPNGATMGASGLSTLNPSDPYSGGGSLPVTIIGFSGKRNNNTVVLSWTTAAEINNDYFTVEKLMTDNEFSFLGNMDGNGNSTSLHEYVFEDANPAEGINYYRLLQTDFDGHHTTYGPVAVTFRKNIFPASVFPNPFTRGFTLELFSEDELSSVALELMNSTGQVISTRNVHLSKGANDILMNEAGDFGPGTFFIRLAGAGFPPQIIPLVHRSEN